MIEIHSFEAAHYEGDCLILKKKDEERYETINSAQWGILKTLKETKDFLAVLLPPEGIAKKADIAEAMELFKKLSRLGILEITGGTGAISDRGRTAEITLPVKKQIHFDSVDSLGASVLGVLSKLLSYANPAGVLVLSIALAGMGLAFFPFEDVAAAVRAGVFSYTKVFAVSYFSFCLGFSLRAVFQAAFIQANKRKFSKAEVALVGIFLCIEIDTSDIAMKGRSGRLRMALTSLFAPLTALPVLLLLQSAGAISLVAAFISAASFIGVMLLSLCPMLAGDAAEILQCMFYPEETEQNLAKKFRAYIADEAIFQAPFLFLTLLSLVWAFVWTDLVRVFVDDFLGSSLHDLYFADDIFLRFESTFFFAFVYLALALPFCLFFFNFSNRLFRSKKEAKQIDMDAKQSLSFEEQMNALEKIPLFAALSDNDRTSLFNEMRSEYFPDGAALVVQGAQGDEFFVLVRGKASASFVDATGKHHSVGSLQEGDAFGEIALIDDVPRTASIISSGGCHALILKKENFEDFLHGISSPDAIKQMIRLTGFLRRHPLFSKLQAKDLALLIEAIRFEFITLNEEVGKEQQGNVYIVYSGRVKADTGDDRTDSTLQAEDFFGYASESSDIKVKALEGAGLLSIRGEDFKTLVWEKFAENPALFS